MTGFLHGRETMSLYTYFHLIVHVPSFPEEFVSVVVIPKNSVGSEIRTRVTVQDLWLGNENPVIMVEWFRDVHEFLTIKQTPRVRSPTSTKLSHDCEPLDVFKTSIVLPHLKRINKTSFLRRPRGLNGLFDQRAFLIGHILRNCDLTSSNCYVLNVPFRYALSIIRNVPMYR